MPKSQMRLDMRRRNTFAGLPSQTREPIFCHAWRRYDMRLSRVSHKVPSLRNQARHVNERRFVAWHAFGLEILPQGLDSYIRPRKRRRKFVLTACETPMRLHG